MREPVNIIVTERLVLRSLGPADAQPLYEHVLSDPQVMRHAFSGEPMQPIRSNELIDRHFDREGSGRKLGVLVERSSTQVIGFAGLLECEALDAADFELGFVLRRSAWGRGFATEIGRAQVEFGFRTLALRRLLALVSPENSASIAVVRKIGMQLHGNAAYGPRGDRQVFVIHNAEVL